MVPEAPLEQTEHGLVPSGDGWFVLNAREARWKHADGRGAGLSFDGWPDGYFPQVGINLWVLAPGEPIGMYHWEADQEDFLVLSGEALLIIEGDERPLRQWDIVHCPPETKHIIIGGGGGACAILAIGAREHQDTPGWGAYTVDGVALRHGAGVKQETTEAKEAYARVPDRKPTQIPRGLASRRQARLKHPCSSGLADHPWFPNGMVVDTRQLDADSRRVLRQQAHRLRDRGRRQPVEPSRVGRLQGGAPDGIFLDAENAVWYGDVPNKRCVRVREGGEVLETIELDRGCFACTLGGADRRTLFLIANEWSGPASMSDGPLGQVLTAGAPAPSAGWP